MFTLAYFVGKEQRDVNTFETFEEADAAIRANEWADKFEVYCDDWSFIAIGKSIGKGFYSWSLDVIV